jgi:hypothetical protein
MLAKNFPLRELTLGKVITMSMEMIILSDRQVCSIAEWQAAIDREDYPLQLAPDMQFEHLSGFLPSHLRGELTGFECFHEDVANMIRDNPDIKFDHEWKYCLAFVWLGSKWAELLAAWMAGTAYAHATDGVIFDGEQEKFVTLSEARQIVHELEHPTPAQKAAMDQVRREFGFDPWPKVGVKNSK